MQQSGQPSSASTGNTTNTQQGPTQEDFREGKMHGKEGHGGSSNPFLVVLKLFCDLVSYHHSYLLSRKVTVKE